MNKTMLIGNLVRDPEIRYTSEGKPVCNFTLAVNNRRTKDVYYFDLVAFGKLAEIIDHHKLQGDELAVTGRLEQSRWEAEDGTKRSRIKVVVEEVDFLRSKGGRQSSMDGACSEDAIEAEEKTAARNKKPTGTGKGGKR